MLVYVTGDTHFGHSKLVQLSGRPENFEELIFKGIKEIPEETDVLVHLGDFALKSEKENIKKFLELSPAKRNILVRGNHDSRSVPWYLKAGFDFVCDTFSLKIFGLWVLFSHIPQEHPLDLNIHGHFHNTPQRFWKEEYFKLVAEEPEKYLLYSPELFDYKPLRIDKKIRRVNYETK